MTLNNLPVAIKQSLIRQSLNSGQILLHYLMRRRTPGQLTVVLDRALRAIASELALTPEALSRLLSRLQTEGIITRKKRSITFAEEWLEDIVNNTNLTPIKSAILGIP